MITQWAEVHFCAAHTGDDGRLHGHTWRVRAYWDYRGQSIVNQKSRLIEALAGLDHAELPATLRRAEDLAQEIGSRVLACRVEVWREPEGVGAEWFA